MGLPLKGIKVLELAAMLPGPFCTQILADYGAEVIKIEPRRGEPGRRTGPRIGQQSARFYAVNRNKQSLTLDLNHPEGQTIFKKLVAVSDVVVVAFRPGLMEKLNLGYEQLKQINERLVYCALNGFGTTGPLSQTAAHDVNILSLAGITDLTGASESIPGMSPVQLAGIAGGSLYAVIAILMALVNREKTGQGQFCDVAMLDGAISLLAYTLADRSGLAQMPRRGEGLLTGGYAYYQVYETLDHKYLSLGALEAKFWGIFCERLERPQYIPWQLEVAHQAEMIADIRDLMAQRTQGEWLALFAEDNLCLTPVLTVEDLENHPQVVNREMIIKQENFQDSGQTMISTGLPIKLSPDSGNLQLSYPATGEHTSTILSALGYSAEEIEYFRTNEII